MHEVGSWVFGILGFVNRLAVEVAGAEDRAMQEQEKLGCEDAPRRADETRRGTGKRHKVAELTTKDRRSRKSSRFHLGKEVGNAGRAV